MSPLEKNHKTDQTHKINVSAPIPLKHLLHPIPRVASLDQLRLQVFEHERALRSFTPLTMGQLQRHINRRPSYGTIVNSRERFYNLDYPDNAEELSKLQLDPKSRFYARSRPRTLDLPRLLPYKIESPQDQAKFLSHIISHLYIAIKTLDIQGSLSVSAKDLAALKDAISDVDLALETNLFEMNNGEEGENGEEAVSEDFETSDDDEDDEDDEEEDEEDEADKDATTQHKKSPKSAAVVGVKTWTHELLVWLKMKYEMPVTLRVSLARVYYAICLCRGQHVSLRTYVKVFEFLTKDQLLLYDLGLRLPWQDLFKELEHHFHPPDTTMIPFEKKDHKQLIKLASRANYFFDKDCLPQIYDKLVAYFSVNSSALTMSSLAILPPFFTPGGVDDENDIRHYLQSFFYMWLKLNKTNGFDVQISSRLGVISMSALSALHDSAEVRGYLKLGKFGLYTESQMEFMINTLLNSLNIMVEKYSSMKLKYFHGFASAIAFSMIGDSALEERGIVHYIRTLVNAIESYIHPSNTGDWTRPISKLILALIYQFHKRYNSENEKDGFYHNIPEEFKLSRKVIKEFVSILLPVVKTGIQAKQEKVTNDYISALQMLAFLDPEYVLENTLLDVYESLEGVISTHRVSTALKTIDTLARFIVSTPVYRVHTTRILLLALPGIDSNDLEKTMQTIEAFTSVSNFAPLYDLTDELGDSALALEFTQEHIEYLKRKIYDGNIEGFQVEKDIEIEALKSSTTAFKELIKGFTQRMTLLLENLPDPDKSTGLERALAVSLPKFMYIMFESMSDDLFKYFTRDFFDFVINNTHHTVVNTVAEICGGIVKRDPSCFKKNARILIDKIKEEVEENEAGGSRTGVEIAPRDQALFWNLTILDEIVGNAGSQIIDMSSEIYDLSFFLMDKVKSPVVFASTYLVNQVLQTLTKIKIKECRLISPDYEKKHGVTEECWGGFWNKPDRFAPENTSFEWFIPSEKDVTFAIEFFNRHVSKSLENLMRLMHEYDKEKNTAVQSSMAVLDDIRLNLLYLAYSLSGVSFLLDPTFEENIPKLSHDTESIQQRLLLLKQIRALSGVSTQKDVIYDENTPEVMEKIMNDLSTEDLDMITDLEQVNEEISEQNDQHDHSDKENGNESTSKDDETGTTKTNSPNRHSLSRFDHSTFSLSRPESVVPTYDGSGRETPQINGVHMSSMNPAITFREKSLYTSNYFFGTGQENRVHGEMYNSIHKTRELVGKSLHVIYKFLVSNFPDNTKILKNFLFVVSIWFSDVGRERNLDASHSKINYGYVSFLQTVNRIRKAFTRVAVGARLELYHLFRLALHATSRTETSLDKLLLEDVVKLSESTYSIIARSAHGILVDAMKRLNGAYSLIVKSSFKHLSKALEADDHKKIESGLSIFAIKKIKGKLQNDFFNLQKYVDLLHRALTVDNQNVYKKAYALFSGVRKGITPPSSVCILDEASIDVIRPPDEFIDLEIKAVKLAKENKRKIYFEKLEKLQDKVLSDQGANGHWKITLLNLELLLNIQAYLEIPTRLDILLLFLKEASAEHPLISRKALEGVARIINKLVISNKYLYNLTLMYDLNFVVPTLEVVNTKPENGVSYREAWKKELKNTEFADYYVDVKPNLGWLFWSESMLAVSPRPFYRVDANASDLDTIKTFSEFITKDWFAKIVKLWVTDGEANSTFQMADVFTVASLIVLISNGFTINFTFEDLLAVVDDIYVPDEKSAHIVTCELLVGILFGTKYLAPEFWDRRDEFVCKYLKRVLNEDLSPDTQGIWNVFSYWLPSQLDIRRFPKVWSEILDFQLDPNSDSAFKDSTRVSYIKGVVGTVSWRLADPDKFLQFCLKNISYKYASVRSQIGNLMAVLSFNYYVESLADSKVFLEGSNQQKGLMLYEDRNNCKVVGIVAELFTQIETWRKEVAHLTPQEILKTNYIYTATTVLTWLRQELNTNLSVMFESHVPTYLVPFLLELINMREVCQLGNIDPITVLKKVSQIPYTTAYLEDIIKMLEYYVNEELNLVQTLVMGEFTETVYFKNLFKLTKEQRQRVFNLSNKLLYHKHVEIRESAADTLSGLIHISPVEDVEEMVNKYSTLYSKQLDKVRSKYRKSGYKNMDSDDIIKLHGATLGLGALVHAFAFSSPPPRWVPGILATLANKSTGIPGIVGKTAKESLGRFKKNRQDSWHIDSKVFTEDQMQDLEGVLWKSYFI
ncbi:Proteasome activator BLM10 [Candida viswanathii]|uniref:Proteasome activator BLM10 n=1 Tax=Candida viswanathii TaxID=5486 RepID=A0A367YP51_9ASCO|nr:Proteasome activator BLM10 [Candida viswanathii]